MQWHSQETRVTQAQFSSAEGACGGILACLTPHNTECNKSADFIDKGRGMQEHFSFRYCHYNPQLHRHGAELHAKACAQAGLVWWVHHQTPYSLQASWSEVALLFSVFNNFKLNIDWLLLP